MKFYLLSFLIIFGVQAQEFLTTTQRAETLTEIDNTCGDTWCEGDYGFKFKKIYCNKKTNSCSVDFTMYENHFCYRTSCTIEKIFSFDDVMNDSDLKWSFYERLTDCINNEEKLFPTKKTKC